MTKNQIDYANYLESKRKNLKQEEIASETLKETSRHNLVSEAQTDYSNATTRQHYERMDAETQRHNVINENETARHNLAQEAETSRSNLAREDETRRSNLAREQEDHRSNVTREKETQQHNAEVERLQDLALEEQQWVNAQQANRWESQNLLDSMNRAKTFNDMNLSQAKLPLDYINTGANVVNSIGGIFGNVTKLALLAK